MPVTVRFQEPVLPLPFVEIVSVEVVPGLLIVLGLNEALGEPPPAGRPLSASLTAPVKPLTRADRHREGGIRAALDRREAGETSIVKSGAGTVKLAQVAVPPGVVTVMGPVVAPEGTLVEMELPSRADGEGRALAVELDRGSAAEVGAADRHARAGGPRRSGTSP